MGVSMSCAGDYYSLASELLTALIVGFALIVGAASLGRRHR